MTSADISHEIFAAFAVYSGLVIAKTMVMSLLTAKTRIGKGVMPVLIQPTFPCWLMASGERVDFL